MSEERFTTENGVTYRAVKSGIGCDNCAFVDENCGWVPINCLDKYRADRQDIIWRVEDGQAMGAG
jgi:hypothetical protein